MRERMPSYIVGKTERSIMWINYVNAIEQGAMVTRDDMAQHFGVSNTTARYHLETAVKRGFLNKQIGFINNNSGWLYARPETMPRLDGMA